MQSFVFKDHSVRRLAGQNHSAPSCARRRALGVAHRVGIYLRFVRRTFGASCLPFLLLASLILLAPPATAQIQNPKEMLEKVGVTTKLGARVDLNLPFTDEFGQTKPLKDFMLGDRPVIVTPVYYHCPRLCGLLMEGLTTLLGELTLTPEKDYQVLSASFDSTETPAAAHEKAGYFRPKVTKPVSEVGWRFLVGNETSVKALTTQLGFGFIPDHDEFAHAPVIMVLTPDGIISQYFTGVNFSPTDIRLALVEAAQGTIGSMIDHVMLYCFRFDPSLGKYTWAAYGLMRTGAVLTLLALAGLYWWLIRRSPKRTKAGA